MDFYYYFIYFISEILIVLLFILAIVFLYNKESNLIQSILSGIMSAVTTEVLKYLFPMERPDNPFLGSREGGGFPSSHTAASFGLAFSVFLVNKKEGIFLFIGAFIVTLGRVLGGAHSIFDVLTGAFIGLMWALILNKFTYDIEFKKSRK